MKAHLLLENIIEQKRLADEPLPEPGNPYELEIGPDQGVGLFQIWRNERSSSSWENDFSGCCKESFEPA